MNEIKAKHPNKIDIIKGNGILNGIIFKSYSSKMATLVEKIPVQVIKDKSFFLKKITATAISSELFEKYNILSAINDSSFSNHLCVSPSLIISHDDVNYFFKSLDEVLQGNLNLKALELMFKFVKSKL